MDRNRAEKIVFNEQLMRRVVYAINKAITEDVPKELREHYLETNNRIRFSPGDYINDNLRHHVVKDEIALIPFKRFIYEGRLLVDYENRITYTIATFATLKDAPKKHGNKPYYLQSLLFAENGDCEGSPKQMTLADYAEFKGLEPFTDDEFYEDFESIMQGTISKTDGYRHYIIGYEVEKSAIKNIRLIFLDKDFAEIDSCSLKEYVKPDFVTLTSPEFHAGQEEQKEDKETRSNRFKIRPGFKPEIRAMEDEV